MKTLVVYYSLEGNTKEAAEKIASALGADVMALVPVKDIPKKGLLKFLHGGSGATKGKGTELQPYSCDASEYDAIVLGTPVWAGKPSMAMNQFLFDLKNPEKAIGAFAFAAGGPGNCGKCLKLLKKKLPSIRYTVGLADRNNKKMAGENESRLGGFIESLKAEG
ncbi:MAG: flavodoxin [Clostridiales bacterium]|nr:flavodoxin [Clostridiales bacterium]